MKVSLEVSPEVIANLFTSAIESGDPVTTASRGGWCNGINLGRQSGIPSRHKTKDGYPWYSNPKIYRDKFPLHLLIDEVDDEETGHVTTHEVFRMDIIRGLEDMAKKFPEIFAQILEDNTDAPCADIFLQCVLFGEEKYA